ncbi:hypothetical protein ACFLZZ_01815 [Nanoarchaeota archaeon]
MKLEQRICTAGEKDWKEEYGFSKKEYTTKEGYRVWGFDEESYGTYGGGN